MKSQKKEVEPQESLFLDFAKKHYREHTRRMKSFRRESKTAVFSYPLLSVIGFTVPVAALVYGFRFAYGLNVARLQEVVPQESYALLLPYLYVAIAGTAAFSLVVGIAWGIAKARHFLFEAEALDLKLRSEFHARELSIQMDELRASVLRSQKSVSASREAGATHIAQGAAEDEYDEDPLAQMLIRHDGRDEHDYEV